MVVGRGRFRSGGSRIGGARSGGGSGGSTVEGPFRLRCLRTT